jgi:hypothetical protein
MPSRRTEFRNRAVRWLLPAALLALTPKCVLCVLAYAGLGAALGIGGPEFCGVPAAAPSSWATLLAWLGAASGLGTLGFLARSRVDQRPTGRVASSPVDPLDHGPPRQLFAAWRKQRETERGSFPLRR